MDAKRHCRNKSLPHFGVIDNYWTKMWEHSRVFVYTLGAHQTFPHGNAPLGLSSHSTFAHILKGIVAIVAQQKNFHIPQQSSIIRRMKRITFRAGNEIYGDTSCWGWGAYLLRTEGAIQLRKLVNLNSWHVLKIESN